MLQSVILLLTAALLTSGSIDPSEEYPKGCKNVDLTVICEGSAIPTLSHNITTLHLKNANPSIPELSDKITILLTNLVSLHLSSAGLKALMPGALVVMPYLEDLHLEDNNITTLYNTTFMGAVKLQNLFLENNNIKFVEPLTFATLHNLQNLSLSHNSLHTLPAMLPTHLRRLSLHHNLLQDVPRFTLHNLTFLSLCYNSLKTIDPQKIDTKNLQELCLGGAAFRLTDKLITQERFPVLESLHLRGTPDSTMDVGDSILKNIQIMSAASLNHLELDFCSITSTNLFSGKNNSLHTLRMTNIKLFQVRTLEPEFKLPSIIVLDFSGSADLASIFLTSPSSLLGSVRILRMSHCLITTFSKSTQELIAPNITHLDLSHNPLTCDCKLSWIPDRVRDGQLILENEKDTICAQPMHLFNIPLLTATICPIARSLLTTHVPELTVNTVSSTGTTEHLTTPPGDSRTNTSHADPTHNGGETLPQKHLILAILGGTAACILLAYLLMILIRKILHHCKKRSSSVYRVIYT